MSKFIKYQIKTFVAWRPEGNAICDAIKVLTIEEVSDKTLTFGDNDNNEWENKNSTFTLKYDIQRDTIASYFNCFRFYEGCQVIPPNDEWLKKCCQAIDEYNIYYQDKPQHCDKCGQTIVEKSKCYKYPLSSEDRELVKECREHWKNDIRLPILDGNYKGDKHKSDNCPLCKVYYSYDGLIGRCDSNCPIKKHKNTCGNPTNPWNDFHYNQTLFNCDKVIEMLNDLIS